MRTHHVEGSPWAVNEADFPRQAGLFDQILFLLRYAILAPSSHNTQPWKFALGQGEVRVLADTARWLRVADADQRELHISLGCALENLLIAAGHFGFEARVAYLPSPMEPAHVATVTLTTTTAPSPRNQSALFAAITARHTNHRRYEARPIPTDVLGRLRACGSSDGILLLLISDAETRRKVGELLTRADVIQFADPSFRQELGYWIGQGVFGTPWLLSRLGQLAVSRLDLGKSTAKKNSDLLMSSPVLGLIASSDNDRVTQVKVGQLFERIYLTAMTLGEALQPMSELVQLPDIKAEVAKLAPLEGAIPQQPFRLGYAEPEAKHTPRRPLTEVLIG